MGKRKYGIFFAKLVFLYIFIVEIIYDLIVDMVNGCYFIEKVFCFIFFKKKYCNTLIAFKNGIADKGCRLIIEVRKKHALKTG